jgi:ubiquinone/menaquinone biosynthesis C-methylase UbiE
MDTLVLNPQKVEAFADRMTGVLNEGALALMCSIGYRTGLFDTMAQIPPATSAQIAAAAGLQERYVREWLNGLVAGQVLSYDPDLGTYYLPPEHAALLTRDAGADNLALYAQYIGVLGEVEDEIVERFFEGGGVPYSAYERFQEVMAEDSGINIVEPLLDLVLPVVSGLKDKLEQGIEVLDVGCGRGRALVRLAETFPNSNFTGLDFSEEAIAVAKASQKAKGLANLRFIVQDAALIDDRNRYDWITTFDAIHDQASPARVLANIARALKPGGVYLMQDVAASSNVQHNLDHALAPFLYTVSTMHCMSVSLAYGGEGLGTMWGKEKALEMLAEAGFSQTDVRQLPHDIMNYYYVSTISFD